MKLHNTNIAIINAIQKILGMIIMPSLRHCVGIHYQSENHKSD